MEEQDPLTGAVIGAVIEVHRILGPGLLESVYERCLSWELGLRGVPHLRQAPVPVMYKGENLGNEFFIDILIDGRLILELKTVERLERIHTAQILTYMKLTQIPLGLIINFNVPVLRDGIKRVIL